MNAATTRPASLTTTVLDPAMRPAVDLAATKLDERVRCPADVVGAMVTTRDEIAAALRAFGYSNAAAVTAATAVILAALQTMGVAWAGEAIEVFDAVLAA